MLERHAPAFIILDFRWVPVDVSHQDLVHLMSYLAGIPNLICTQSRFYAQPLS
jgi:hypothetical protein